jgi:hypothetical protein
VETIWIELHAPHSVIEPVSVLARILGRLTVSLVLKSQFGPAVQMGTSTAITRDVGDHAFLKCNLLNLARHATQIHQYAINLGHPHQRVVIQ